MSDLECGQVVSSPDIHSETPCSPTLEKVESCIDETAEGPETVDIVPEGMSSKDLIEVLTTATPPLLNMPPSANPHSPVEEDVVPEGMSSAEIKETDVQADQKKTTQTKMAPRIKRPSPVPECQGAMYTNIWNHLFQTHKAQNKYSDEELRRFMDVAKLQTPTTRRKAEEKTTLPNSATTVKESDDGNVYITRVDVRPSSSGRERFGAGTKLWPKFSLEDGLDCFERYVS